MNKLIIKYKKDGSIDQCSNMRLFKLSNGVTTIEAHCQLDSNDYNAYINFELPTMERINSRPMIPSTAAPIDGYYIYNYLIQADELKYKGKLTFSVTFEGKYNE